MADAQLPNTPAPWAGYLVNPAAPYGGDPHDVVPADPPNYPPPPGTLPADVPVVVPDHPIVDLIAHVETVLAHDAVQVDGNTHGLLTQFVHRLRSTIPLPMTPLVGDEATLYQKRQDEDDALVASRADEDNQIAEAKAAETARIAAELQAEADGRETDRRAGDMPSAEQLAADRQFDAERAVAANAANQQG